MLTWHLKHYPYWPIKIKFILSMRVVKTRISEKIPGNNNSTVVYGNVKGILRRVDHSRPGEWLSFSRLAFLEFLERCLSRLRDEEEQLELGLESGGDPTSCGVSGVTPPSALCSISAGSSTVLRRVLRCSSVCWGHRVDLKHNLWGTEMLSICLGEEWYVGCSFEYKPGAEFLGVLRNHAADLKQQVLLLVPGHGLVGGPARLLRGVGALHTVPVGTVCLGISTVMQKYNKILEVIKNGYYL